MRKIPALLAITALAAVALVGCAPAAGTANSFGCTPSAEPGATTALVKVSGDLGAQPDAKTPAFTTVASVQRAETVKGEGRQITDPDQIVTMTVTILSTATGVPAVGTPYGEAEAPTITPVQLFAEQSDAFSKAVVCARAGSRLVIAVPGDDLSAQAQQSLGATGKTGAVAIVDVLEVLPSKAEGTPVFNAAPGLPSVVRAPNGEPGVTIPNAAAPKRSTAELLIKGDGAAVTKDELDTAGVYLKMSKFDWETREQASTTWGSSRAVGYTAEGMPAAMAKAIVGAPVGSQIMVVDGSADSHDGKASVYVIDVLGVPKK